MEDSHSSREEGARRKKMKSVDELWMGEVEIVDM